MKPPGIVVASLLFTIGYAGFFATRPDTPPVQVIEQFTLPDQPVTLNEDLVTRFLYGFAPVAAAVREVDGQGEPTQRRAVLDLKAQEFGFADYADWVDTTNTIMVTYHWATHPQPRPEVEKTIALVPTMANLSQEQRSAMIADLRNGLARIENARPTAENLAVVNRHLRTLKPFYTLWAQP
ncbi:MAG: hypothetical protein ACRECY_20330 [Phyllobacterium sp.]